MDSPGLVRFVKSVTARLPRRKGFGRLGSVVATFVKKRWVGGPIWLWVNEFYVCLDPGQTPDNQVIFLPQWYDYNELAALSSCLAPGDCFVDVGANTGMYSLAAFQSVGSNGHIISIEANPLLAEVLRSNLQTNDLTNVSVHQTAVSSSSGDVYLHIHTGGNHGGSTLEDTSFSSLYGRSIIVPSVTLDTLVDRPVRLMKIDIEGHELSVLSVYFSNSKFRPNFILVEQGTASNDHTGVVQMLVGRGYVLTDSWGLNHFLVDLRRA